LFIAASPPTASPPHALAVRAYGAAQAARPQRAQEAEVFSILAGRLRAAQRSREPLDAVRAAADARRLFSVLDALVVHPSSPLPQELRIAIATVARRALREVEEPTPDLDFLASIAEDFAAGLSASGPSTVGAPAP
jgi:flagellar biosynthesis regulator FlaF